ncbi:MAG: hypothetical protein ACRDIV_26925 [Ktedonobacteraceae bacterium]
MGTLAVALEPRKCRGEIFPPQHEDSWQTAAIVPKSASKQLHPPHNHLRQQLLWAGHDGATAEKQAHEVEFQHVGFLSKFGGVVDARAVLFKGCVATGLLWLAGIDRYLEESAASAAQRF